MWCGIFVAVSFILFAVNLVGFLVVIDAYANYKIWTRWSFFGGLIISIALVCCSVTLFDRKADVLRTELLNSGQKISFTSSAYNTPYIERKIIIKGGSDLTYYEILD